MGLLVAFEACARLQKFTAAAEELSLTQSAVSRQIRALEDIVGVELFARERQTVRLTPAGEAYAEELRQALRAISHATLRLKASPGAGTLTLAILPTMGTRWLAPLLPDFTQKNPGVTLNLVTRLEPFNMETDGVDAALHYGTPEWPRAELDFLFEETVVPACSRALKAQHGFATPADLLAAPLLHLASRPQAWADWFGAQGLVFGGGTGMSTDQFATAMQAAAAGLGVALLPEFLFQQELARGELVSAVDVRSRSAGRYYLACAANRAWYPPLTAFRRWIRTQAADITA
ncbi:MAG: LysR family transcriptional regulator [Variovorax paradoxus]|jgi:LysR family glycine cleavage system transcriptional activator|nr:LysR family transcriptional regulator [Pseudorhodoferax sp. Leaf265]PZP94491.1 MAG: LysR family transcriptional regulator [Variovorax paradoxus]PZQ05074.1 MAG: LysR family transcriptional regulator [Variovorax paradoxus]